MLGIPEHFLKRTILAIFPKYMMAIRSQMYLVVARSWVMNKYVRSKSSLSLIRSSSESACTDTSAKAIGSSATINCAGDQGAGQHDALALPSGDPMGVEPQSCAHQ